MKRVTPFFLVAYTILQSTETIKIPENRALQCDDWTKIETCRWVELQGPSHLEKIEGCVTDCMDQENHKAAGK